MKAATEPPLVWLCAYSVPTENSNRELVLQIISNCPVALTEYVRIGDEKSYQTQ